MRVAIVGATGAVGREMKAVLEERGFPVSDLRLLASGRSAGTVIDGLTVEEASPEAFAGVDLALFSASSGVARRGIVEPVGSRQDRIGAAPDLRGAQAVAIPVSSLEPAPSVPVPLEEVEPGTPAVLPPFPEDAAADRLGLARWLTDPGHPLTALALARIPSSTRATASTMSRASS